MVAAPTSRAAMLLPATTRLPLRSMWARGPTRRGLRRFTSSYEACVLGRLARPGVGVASGIKLTTAIELNCASSLSPLPLPSLLVSPLLAACDALLPSASPLPLPLLPRRGRRASVSSASLSLSSSARSLFVLRLPACTCASALVPPAAPVAPPVRACRCCPAAAPSRSRPRARLRVLCSRVVCVAVVRG